MGDGEKGAVFRGVSHLALDAKGRLAIPAKHRDALGGPVGPDGGHPHGLVLTADPGRCLLLYPRAEWEPIQARLMAMSSFNETIRALQRLIVGHADDVEMDGSGRILVPPSLRQYAALEHRVVLVGQGNKFELWDESRWLEQTAKAVAFPNGSVPPELSGFSL
jgi:MraZ protein